MNAYIDTSVLGAYYCPEALSSAAEHALRAIEVPVISGLSELEFCSLIAKKRRLQELTTQQAQKILDLFGNHVSEGFYRRISLTGEHYLKARELVGSTRIPLHTLDALHLAAALIETLPVLTADKGLAAAAKRHKAKVIMIRAGGPN
jgi:predicted nucleic acid-binding protein